MLPESVLLIDQDVGVYPLFNDIGMPDKYAGVHHISIGPSELNASGGVLTSKYWRVYYSDSKVWIDSECDSATILFSVSIPVVEMNLAFDQLGRAIVFYKQGDGQLFLYWFNPVLSVIENRYIGVGDSPVAAFDNLINVSDSDADVLIFYTRNDVGYYRVQRDRFDIEYEAIPNRLLLELLSSGMRVDNRFQVVYRYKDVGYKPPEVIPPVVEPQTGYWKYRLSGYGSRISIEHNFWYDTKDDLTVSFIIDEVDLTKPDIVLFSQCFATHSVAQGSSQGKYGAQLLATVGGVDHSVLSLIVGGYETVMPLPVSLQPGTWSFDFLGGQGATSIITISFTPVDGNDTVTIENKYSIGRSLETAYVLIFGGDGSKKPVNSFRGIMREMRASSMGRDIYCPADDNSVIGGEYLPVYNADRTVTLYNAHILNDYRKDNWIFQPT